MKILKIASLLLDYPTEELRFAQSAIEESIESSSLSVPLRRELLAFVNDLFSMELMEWQSHYDGLFERGRSLGLWLFEHVHGESRDRGQAMVDLNNKYREAGLFISEHQLPDYIPMFLEFLTTQGEDNARAWLRDVEHILALLQCRLERRTSGYSLLFQALLEFANSDVDMREMREVVAEEKRDDSKQAIDKEWQEEEVTFGAQSLEQSCDQAVRRPTEQQRKDLDLPLTWVDFDDSSANQRGVTQ